MSAKPQLVVGTAGHVDHGKSRLVLSLTGVDPDRLPEEKARGMTIDLGFGHAEVNGCDLYFVDVPGHERFIRNMVAGASGIDLALLVVAADDSVMPQTREHAELLSLLGVPRCLLVLTKVDLVTPDWAAQVEEEARRLMGEFGLNAREAVHTSAETGAGLDELRAALAREAREVALSPEREWFRLAVDRVFTVAGRGTVVTGTAMHGQVARDDELELWPGKRRVRVRDLQTHNEQRAAAAGRLRLAINLAGLAADEVQRGCELATPGYLAETHVLDVYLHALRSASSSRRAQRVRLHTATSEVLAQVRRAVPFAGEEALAAVQPGLAQIVVARPLVAEWGQRFVLRDESGERTLGGGMILRPSAQRWTARRPARLDALTVLRGSDAAQRMAAEIEIAGWCVASDAQLAAQTGLADAGQAAETVAALRQGGTVRQFDAAGQRLLVHAVRLSQVAAEARTRLEAHLRDQPRSAGVAQSEWPNWMPRDCPARFRAALAQWVIENAGLETRGGFVRVPAASALRPEDQKLLDAALAEIDAGGFQPPALAALACRSPRNERRLAELLELARANGELVRLDEGLWLHARQWNRFVTLVREALLERQKLTVAEIRTLSGSTRKFIVPMVERLDALRITRRVGDERVLASASA